MGSSPLFNGSFCSSPIASSTLEPDKQKDLLWACSSKNKIHAWADESEIRCTKMGRTSDALSLFPDKNQILSFSQSMKDDSFCNTHQPFASNLSYNAGWEQRGLNETMHELLARVKGPFTPLQWMELEHQALIYKYLNAKAPVPSSLLISICRNLINPSAFSLSTRSLGHDTVGWRSVFQAGGYSGSGDAEPWRCRRTDGKKWRCSRQAVPDHKYCERHMMRSRHRSRKPVEHSRTCHVSPPNDSANPQQARNSVSSPIAPLPKWTIASKEKEQTNGGLFSQLEYQIKSSPNLGSSYLENTNNVSNTRTTTTTTTNTPTHLLKDFIGDWSKTSPNYSGISRSKALDSRNKFDSTRLGLGVGVTAESVVGVASVGGPLGEILASPNSANLDQYKNLSTVNSVSNGLEWTLS